MILLVKILEFLYDYLPVLAVSVIGYYLMLHLIALSTPITLALAIVYLVGLLIMKVLDR